MGENLQAQIQGKISDYQNRAVELEKTVNALQAQALMLRGAAKGLMELLNDMEKEVPGGAVQPEGQDQ